MTELSRFWDGTSVGDATVSPYDAATEFAQVMMLFSQSNRANNRGGVFYTGIDLSRLTVTNPSANTVRVSSGRAVVYGTWYQNDANVDVNIPTPSVSTRVDRIVLRKSWAAQTVRITRIAGVEGGGTPAMTQTVGVTWDIPLFTVSITTGAAITLGDVREFIDINGGTDANGNLIVGAGNNNVYAGAVGLGNTVSTPSAPEISGDGSNVYIAANNASIYLRPVGSLSTTAQGSYNNAGLLAIAGGLTNAAGDIQIPGSTSDGIRGSDATAGKIRFRSVVVNDTANAQLAWATGTGIAARAWILSVEDASVFSFNIRGTAAATTEVDDPQGIATGTATTASSVNVYWSGGNNRYEIENRRGGARTFRIMFWGE